MSQTPRLYVPDAIAEGDVLALSQEQIHKLLHVLRLRAGASLQVFNGRDGEFRAELAPAGKNLAARVLERTRAQTSLADVRLLVAPLKRPAMEWLVEKATELGAAVLQPVSTERSVADHLRIDRLRAIVQSSAEQCERLQLTQIGEVASLPQALHAWPSGASLLFADETAALSISGGHPAVPLAIALSEIAPQSTLGLLIGPEGGFTPQERASLLALPFVKAVSLGPRILRAETAAIAALSITQANWGDWRAPLC